MGGAEMIDLLPLDTLYETSHGTDWPLPAELANLYGALRFSPQPHRPYVIGNFVTTLDGVVSLSVAEKSLRPNKRCGEHSRMSNKVTAICFCAIHLNRLL